ncbi:MAG: HAD family phosphatase [Eubacteriales bacterium]|nr:HAD family phosphatase [Eubacteriales bacterium]
MRDRLKEFEAVIFDLDGTLVDSMWMWYEIDVQYLGRFGLEPPEDVQDCIEGMSFSETAAYFKERFSIPDSLEEIKAEWNAMAKDKYRHEVPFKKGALEFLKFCKSNGIKLGVATSNSRELVNSVAEALPIKEYMDDIITACEVKRGKPAPDVYLAEAERLGVDPAKCLVFEDLVAGIMAGKSAGMTVCCIEDDYSKDAWDEKVRQADYHICDYEELLDMDLDGTCRGKMILW